MPDLALLPRVQKKRELVPAVAEKRDIAALVRKAQPIEHERVVEAGLFRKLRRQEAVPRALLERIRTEKVQDDPELVPVRALVARVVERNEARKEPGSARGVVVDLVDERLRQAAFGAIFPSLGEEGAAE